MTDQDVQELKEIEIAVIYLVKLWWEHRNDLNAFIKAALSDSELHQKVKAAADNCTDIVGEVKNMSISKVIDLVVTGVKEIA